MGSEAQVSVCVLFPPILAGFRQYIWIAECCLHSGMHRFQMGWSEEFSEPTKAASVLWRQQRHQGFRQILQEPAFLLDSWSWALCKSEVWSLNPNCAILFVFLNLDKPKSYLFSRGILSLIAGACRPALYRAEHDQQHDPVASKLVDSMWFMPRTKVGLQAASTRSRRTIQRSWSAV
jgi:hypothetical protein